MRVQNGSRLIHLRAGVLRNQGYESDCSRALLNAVNEEFNKSIRARREQMTTTIYPESIAVKSGATRLASIDILRGLTMTMMIFVNELAGVKGLPWWNYHMKAEIDAMTYVDMVFPFFLFIVGLSLPIAMRARLKRNPSLPALWMHVALRTASLMTLGLILANADDGDGSRMFLQPAVWAIVGLTGCALFLNEYGPSERYASVFRWLRIVGLALVVAMFAIFRHTPNPGHGSGYGSWIDFGYPEILGLIGYTYFAVCILYIPTRRWLWAPFAWFIAMMAFNALTAAKWITFADRLPYWFWPFSNGAMAGIMFAGIVTSIIFLGAHRWQTLRQKTLLGVSFGIAALIAGWLLTPLGISKIRATPTWSLYSIGAAVLLFTALYWICDVKKKTGWAFFARPAGANTLTTYLLPDFWYYILAAAGIRYFDTHFVVGLPGAVRCAVFTAFILAVAAVLTRWRVRLRL
jgi:predicted acyltransferase